MALRRTQVAYCTLKAPFAGKVAKKIAQPYQYVQLGEPLLDIIDDNTLVVEFIMPSRWLAEVKIGHPLSVHIDETAKSYTGAVSRFAAQVDPVSQSIKVFANLEGEHTELLTGMSGVLQLKSVLVQ